MSAAQAEINKLMKENPLGTPMYTNEIAQRVPRFWRSLD